MSFWSCFFHHFVPFPFANPSFFICRNQRRILQFSDMKVSDISKVTALDDFSGIEDFFAGALIEVKHRKKQINEDGGRDQDRESRKVEGSKL